MATSRPDTVRAHWKCIAACTLVSMCPFQYGVDFGIIGGLQAMPGFLEVCPLPRGHGRVHTDSDGRCSDLETQNRPSDGTSITLDNSSFPR
jgi:hypothetical protein